MVKQAIDSKGVSTVLEEVALLLRKSELKLKEDRLLFMVRRSRATFKKEE